jgi:hypothetical protein
VRTSSSDSGPREPFRSSVSIETRSTQARRMTSRPSIPSSTEGRHQADDRTGRGSADGVHADVESVLVAEMVEPDEQRGGGPGLVRAERSAPGQRQAEAQVGHG